MDDIEGEHLNRDLNEQDDLDNLDLQYDRQAEALDWEKFNSELLFAVQGLGSVKHLNGIEIYVKGPHCEDSIKDLIRLVRKDDPDEPLARKKLAIWKTFENDLMQLLLTQFQDKKLAFYLILLMVNLTEQPSKTCVIKNEIRDALTEYKLSFLKPQAIGTLMQHLGDCIETFTITKKQQLKGEHQSKAHEQMIELIIILVKNILAVRDQQSTEGTSNEVRRNLHFHLLCQMKREHCFDLLIFLTQDFAKLDVLKKLDLVFLEIFYHIFGSFDANWLASAPGNQSSEFRQLIEKDRKEKQKIMEMTPARHTRFQADFRFKRLLDTTKKLTTNPFSETKENEVNVSKHQMQKPVARKVIGQTETIFRKRLHVDIKVDMPLPDHLIQSMQAANGEEDDEMIKSELVQFKQVMLQFAVEFIRYSFCPVIEQCYNLIYSENEKIEPMDIIYYFVLIGFGIKMSRILIFEKKSSELEIVDIAVALQLTQFQLIFSKLVKEVTNKKKNFNIKNFYASVYAFYELMHIIRSMSLDTSQVNRKNSTIMLQNVFHHDITKALRIGLDFCQKGVLNDEILKTLVELIGVFFDLLESYSKGKVLTLQTDRLVKKKKEKKKNKSKMNKMLEEELKEFVEEDIEGEGNGESDDGDFNPEGGEQPQKSKKKSKKEQAEDDDDDEDDDEDDDAPRFQERQYNLKSEFAILADYVIVEKILYLIKEEKILSNSSQLNDAIYKFINRVSDLLQADWLFYQVDFLAVFNQIVQHKEIKLRMENKKFIELIRKILKTLFAQMQKNKLMIVEMLFRFPDYQIKNSILNNYADMAEKDDPLAENEFEQQSVEERKIWIENEDRVLIKNYYLFKDLENVYDQLSLVLNSIGSYDKMPNDVRRRVKYLKLHKSQERAQEIFDQIYSSKKATLDSAVKGLLDFIQNQKNENRAAITLEEVKLFVESAIINFKEYLQMFDESEELQQQSSKTTPDVDSIIQIQDFCVVPITPKEFELIDTESVQLIIESLGFRRPGQGQVYWRIPGYFSVSQIDAIFENMTNLMENNKNNMDGQPKKPQPILSQDIYQLLNEQEESQDEELEYNKHPQVYESLENQERSVSGSNRQTPTKRGVKVEQKQKQKKYSEIFEEDYDDEEENRIVEYNNPEKEIESSKSSGIKVIKKEKYREKRSSDAEDEIYDGHLENDDQISDIFGKEDHEQNNGTQSNNVRVVRKVKIDSDEEYD